MTTLTLNKSWVDYIPRVLVELTPVEYVSGMFFKREDKFSPMGPGLINGSKLRQLIWLVDGQVRHRNCRGVVSGAVSGSPQHIMAAAVCWTYHIPYIGVVGGKSTADKPLLQVAEKLFGAEFRFSSVGYAKTLNSIAEEIATSPFYSNFFHLETNIVVTDSSNTPARVRGFHDVGGHQVRNIPGGIKTLIIPCGSATSTLSILHGMRSHGWPSSLQQIILMGIGNVGSSDLSFIPQRLRYMGWEGWPAGLEYIHYDLNGSGYCRYEDLMPADYGGIQFHPRYEGKCIRWLREFHPEHFNAETLFWIVGAEPKF